MASIRILFIGLAAALCAGCGGSSGTAEPAFENTCPRGLTRPISVHSLIATANAHGISLERDPDCSAYIGGVDAASNVVDTDSGEYDEITSREGHVLCELGDDPLRDLERVRRTKYPEDEETSFDVANVSCTIYPERPEHVDQLQAALGAVARGPVERRDCPRGRPKPIGFTELVEAARRQGIELQKDLRCIAPGVVAQASNLLPYEASFGDEVEREQGRVTCLLRRAADPAASTVEEAKATVTTQFRFRNLECWVTPLPDVNERHVDAVRALFADLSR
jgi:hypothetical protein